MARVLVAVFEGFSTDLSEPQEGQLVLWGWIIADVLAMTLRWTESVSKL